MGLMYDGLRSGVTKEVGASLNKLW